MPEKRDLVSLFQHQLSLREPSPTNRSDISVPDPSASSRPIVSYIQPNQSRQNPQPVDPGHPWQLEVWSWRFHQR